MEEQGVQTGPARSDRPWYQSTSFWTGPFLWITALLIGIVLGVGWYILGGFPRDHDRYGATAVPGATTVELPEGDVRLNFENNAHRSGDSTTLDDQPEGLAVRVVPASGGDPLEVEDVPSWIFSSTSGDRGHEPFGKIDVPEEGSYVVQATDSASGGFAAPPPRGATADDAGPEITIGQSPWTPLDSKLLGAIVCAVAVVLVIMLLSLPLLLMGRRRG